MTDLIRECLLDMPLSNMANRPEGMIAIRCQDVPEDYRPMVDTWVEAHGGHVAEEPLIVVHGGKTPAGGGGAQYWVLPPESLAPADGDADSGTRTGTKADVAADADADVDADAER